MRRVPPADGACDLVDRIVGVGEANGRLGDATRGDPRADGVSRLALDGGCDVRRRAVYGRGDVAKRDRLEALALNEREGIRDQ